MSRVGQVTRNIYLSYLKNRDMPFMKTHINFLVRMEASEIMRPRNSGCKIKLWHNLKEAISVS